MVDTTPDNERKQLEIYLNKTESERFKISDDLVTFGFKVLEASIRQENHGISDIDIRAEVIRRCYKEMFSTEELEQIINSMRQYLASTH